ncbi:PD-(D/E)XK nuclease-like domain-containing protein [Citrobacter sp. CK187]|uniref:RecE family exodeoxyribonuclease n=1 Tax=Citrobacter sp. CK187 TaxID=2985096 RepID=UPI0025762C9F|nr:RecE family exodeoxyribonuclease [Citrobacter sp. CK187]ELO4690807.1 PD-(D/E)XK nuclease-like domain-containing protein [Citrobacter koseri]MDM3014466.1 PD-(D/E)XK nuclease-like domain-containing protein [Citrobacter sp. CK187]
MSGTNPVFLVRKAKKSSGQKDAVLWCSDDFEAANATLDYLLIKSGAKLKDYFKAVATNFPVVNELPPEGELSLTFCDFYQLGKDNMTWVQIPGVTLPPSDAAAEARQRIVDGVDTETGEIIQHEQVSTEDNGDRPEHPQLTVVATMPFRHRVLAQHIGDGEYLYHIDTEQKKAILALEMDTDNSYIQNLLLAAENVEAFKKAIEHDIHKVVNAVKNVFPADGKIPELASVIQFLKTWFDTPHIDRRLLVKEWCKGNRVSAIQRTGSGANAGGGNKTDRNPDYVHTLDTLDQEIALATLPMDFNIYELPGSVYRRAKEIVKKKESPFKEWSAALRATPGILDYSRAAIFALIRSAHPEFYHYPGRLQGYINAYLTESDHENPTAKTLTAARHTPEKDAVEEANRQLAAERGEYVEGISDPNDPKWVKTDAGKQEAEPELVKKVAAGIFDVSALMQNSSTHGTKQEAETTSDVQVQETVSDEKQTGDALRTSESDLGNGEEADTGEQADVDHNQSEVSQNNDSANHSEPEAQQNAPETQQEKPAPEWPEYFEPGRYEGVPNEVYHAANGISSTMVKDARVSLMYFHSRHIDKTISRESTEALSFGSLVHTLVLEPEKLDDEFAIFPGIPAGAFTNTDTLKAFIREYNADKPKAEQLKLTGKKEDLQESIRTVNPDAIFADEYEQQWRESIAGKTILTSEQLMLAKNIQQAIFNNSDASDLLNNPGRQSEVSYFGIDEETGLNIRVRPDIELRTANENTCADLKTISIGNVRQDRIKERLHREIIDRDYHLSAAMYCDVAGLDSFSWIFVNKEPGYHWVAVVEASELLLELGRKEYRRVLRQIYDAMENDIWPAPITETYTDDLNDYDIRRLEALDAE